MEARQRSNPDAPSLLEAWGMEAVPRVGKLSFESLNQENDENYWTCEVLGQYLHL